MTAGHPTGPRDEREGQQRVSETELSVTRPSTVDQPSTGVWCPACLRPATYLRRLDRFIHDVVLREFGIDPLPHALPRDHRDAAEHDESMRLHDLLAETHWDCWRALLAGQIPEAAWPPGYMPWRDPYARRRYPRKGWAR